MAHLNTSGEYRCVYVNVEGAQAAREDVAAAMQAMLGELARVVGVLSESTASATYAPICW